jgi:hypothetical protein
MAIGTYKGEWQLRSEGGEVFGLGPGGDQSFWVQVVVAYTATPTATRTPNPSSTPVLTSTSTLTPTVAWRGEYFGNRALAGAPVVIRDEAAVSFNWGAGAPAGGLPLDGFSARWSRAQLFEEGLYRFYLTVDDGGRLYLDGDLVIDEWKDGTRRELRAERRLAAGSHTVRVEYYEGSGLASAELRWEKLTAYPDWKGEYWGNSTLSGNPVVVRNDPSLDFTWSQGPAQAGLPSDSFSARWTRTLTFEAATYRFHVLVDDGARLWVDSTLVVDEWRGGGEREATGDHALAPGGHSLRLEFFEVAGEARIKLWWEALAAPDYPDWKGEYWNNTTLSGTPQLVRNDKTLAFTWSQDPPAVGLPADRFSARWTRTLPLEPGVYRFSAQADDGIRVWLAGQRIIDQWHDSDGSTVYTVDLAVAGAAPVMVEYYDGTGNARVAFSWIRIGDVVSPTAAVTTPQGP